MKYSRPPLAFMGNKKNMLNQIKEVLQDMRGNGYINNETIFIDVFGGSGLIAHNIKQMFPTNKVIWNDYDNYKERLDNIESTEILRKKMYEIITSGLIYDRLPQSYKERILHTIKEHKEKGYFIDYATISTYIMFGGSYAKDLEDLEKCTFYNRIAKEAVNKQGYLYGVERVRQDFKDLLDSYSHIQNKLLILDPPYLQTQKGNYRAHFTLGQFFELITRVKKPYIFFGSENSDIIESFEYFKAHNKELENYTFNKGYLNMGGKDYILYPQERNLFENRKIV